MERGLLMDRLYVSYEKLRRVENMTGDPGVGLSAQPATAGGE